MLEVGIILSTFIFFEELQRLTEHVGDNFHRVSRVDPPSVARDAHLAFELNVRASKQARRSIDNDAWL